MLWWCVGEMVVREGFKTDVALTKESTQPNAQEQSQEHLPGERRTEPVVES